MSRKFYNSKVYVYDLKNDNAEEEEYYMSDYKYLGENRLVIYYGCKCFTITSDSLRFQNKIITYCNGIKYTLEYRK